mmetsp:Transcript_154906/g.269724  ORF Transcript_154906/g.269724 Transcript_154906/m.269724 type:complete len:222 (-) Transcript_154906:529-1194(-)
MRLNTAPVSTGCQPSQADCTMMQRATPIDAGTLSFQFNSERTRHSSGTVCRTQSIHPCMDELRCSQASKLNSPASAAAFRHMARRSDAPQALTCVPFTTFTIKPAYSELPSHESLTSLASCPSSNSLNDSGASSVTPLICCDSLGISRYSAYRLPPQSERRACQRLRNHGRVASLSSLHASSHGWSSSSMRRGPSTSSFAVPAPWRSAKREADSRAWKPFF